MSKKHRVETNLVNAPSVLAYAKRRGQGVRRGTRREVRFGLLMEHKLHNGRRRSRIVDLPHRITIAGAVYWPEAPEYSTSNAVPRDIYVAATRDGLTSGVGLSPLGISDVEVNEDNESSLFRSYGTTFFGTMPDGSIGMLTRGNRDKDTASISTPVVFTELGEWEGEPFIEYMPMSEQRPLGVALYTSAHHNRTTFTAITEDVITSTTGYSLVARGRQKPQPSADQLYLFASEVSADWGRWGTTMAFPGVSYTSEPYDHGSKGVVFAYIGLDPVAPLALENSPSSIVSYTLPDVPQFGQGVWVNAGDDHEGIPITGRLPSFIRGDVVAPVTPTGVQVGEFMYFGVYYGGVDTVVDDGGSTTDAVDYITTLFFADSAGNYQVIRSTTAHDLLPDVPLNPPQISNKPMYDYMTAFYAAGLVWGVCLMFEGDGTLNNGSLGLTTTVNFIRVVVVNEFGIVAEGLPAACEMADFSTGGPITAGWGPAVLGGSFRRASQSVFACHLNTEDHFGFTFAVIHEGVRKLAKWDTIDGFGLWGIEYGEFADTTGAIPSVNCYRRVEVTDEGTTVGDPGFVVTHDSSTEGGTFVVTSGETHYVAPVAGAGGSPTGNKLSVKGSTSYAYQVYTVPEGG